MRNSSPNISSAARFIQSNSARVISSVLTDWKRGKKSALSQKRLRCYFSPFAFAKYVGVTRHFDQPFKSAGALDRLIAAPPRTTTRIGAGTAAIRASCWGGARSSAWNQSVGALWKFQRTLRPLSLSCRSTLPITTLVVATHCGWHWAAEVLLMHTHVRCVSNR